MKESGSIRLYSSKNPLDMIEQMKIENNRNNSEEER